VLNNTIADDDSIAVIEKNLHHIKNNQIYENDSILNLARKTLDLSKKMNYNEGMYMSYYYMAQIFRFRNFNDSAIYYYKKGLELPIDKEEHLANYHMQLSNIQRITGNYSAALENALILKDIVESNENSVQVYEMLNLLALSYQTLKEYDQAFEYYTKSAALALADSNEAYAGIVYANIGKLLFDQNRLDESLQYFEQGTRIEEKYNMHSSLGNSYNIIARILLRKDLPDSARYYLFKAAELNKKAGNKIGLTHTLMAVSEYYFLIKDYDNALAHLDRTIQYALEINLKNILSEAYQLKAKIYEQQENYKQAFKHFELFFNTYNSIYDFEELNKVKSLQQKLYQQERASELFEVRLQKQKTINVLLILVVGLILIVGIIISVYLFQFKKLNKDLVKSKVKAEESDQLKSKFLQTISHEIRTPLNGIVGFSEIIRSRKLSDKELVQIDQMINKNSDDLISTIENLVDIAHITTNQYNVNKSHFAIMPVMEQIMDKAKENPAYIAKSNLRLTSKYDHDIELYSDKDVISKIILHLVRNAVNYTEQGEISLGFQKDKSEVIFYVKDTGVGIPQEKLDVIFNPFSQGDENISIKVGGTGLGLTIVNELIQILDGRIWVGSEPGKGSIFYIALPLG